MHSNNSSAAGLADFNILLASLHPDDLDQLRPHFRREALRGGEEVAATTVAAARVCFPETAVVAFGEAMPDRSQATVGLIGREGMIGWSLLMGATAVPYSGIVQLSGGNALFIAADVLKAQCVASPALHMALLRFVFSFTEQMSRTVIAGMRDGVDRRLARWLLMLHDRVSADVLRVTHGELAASLHVRRASVTDCLHVLEGQGVVRCSRGQMVVRDRAALEAAAGDGYGAAERSYRTLVGPFGRGVSARSSG